MNSRSAMLSIAAVLVTASIAAGSSANAAAFSFTQIDVPGAVYTEARGINDAGQVVGVFADGTGGHGFLYRGGSFTQIDVPGARGTSAGDINNAGQIVGFFADSMGISHGFLDKGGSFTQIDVPGAIYTYAQGINDAGQIVGIFQNSTGLHGFLHSGGSFTQIDKLGADFTDPSGINDAGQIVGQFQNSSTGLRGFLYSGGNFTQIDVPGADYTNPSRINDAEQIVGYFHNTTGYHGFINSDGSVTQIDVPGPAGTSTYALDMNEAGQIVGLFVNRTGFNHGFRATAIGDPHFTTYDGVKYSYQGVGDFLLARSTVPGDQFDVQIRTTGFFNAKAGATASLMTQAAATLCGHVVTFNIDRVSGSMISLDGSAMPLSVGSSVLTGEGCRISALSKKDYQVAWNTGEILDVTDKGKYLDLASELSWISRLGPIEGLLSSASNPDAWRVTGAGSLLNYVPELNPVPEPSTLTLLSVGMGFSMLCLMRRREVQATPLG